MRDGYSEPIMSVDLLSYYFICFFRYPAIENAFLQYSYGNPGNPNSERASLEYFFSSGNYSRAKKLLSNDSEISLIKILSVYGCSGWFKGNPYLALLNHYLEHFLPVVLPKEDQPIIQSHYLAQDRIGNLFLRLLIDIWIDTIGIIRCPSDRSLPHIAQHDPNLSSIRLSDFYNCSRVYLFDSSSSTFPTRHTFQCIYIVVVHLMAEASPHNPMPYALSMLQQPIFDLLRGIFARYSNFYPFSDFF